MTTEVTFPVDLGGDGITYNDGITPPYNLGRGGHRDNFAKVCANTVAMAQTAVEAAADALASETVAAAAAATATGAPNTACTSTTSMTLGTGSKALTIQTGKSIYPGQHCVVAQTSDPLNKWEFGQVSSYDGSTGAIAYTVAAGDVHGSGTHADWSVSFVGPKGATGASGTNGTNGVDGATGVRPLAVKTGDFTAVAGNDYACTSAVNNITLPASAAANDRIGLARIGSAYFAPTILRNGLKIEGATTDHQLDLKSVELVYSGSTYGWIIQ